MALNFRLFNCDRTFSLDKVEALIQRVAAKLSREVNIEKTYFPLPRMKELCEELEKDGSHFDYAVFVVHAHESRLSINEKNAGIGYARVYRALQKVTDDRVLIVIGGDDNYKDQEERDKSVLSRWAWHKIFSQFTEDYFNGVKSFIFSWEENHHPIHEEALEFYLNPAKKGTQFVPRPRPRPVKVPEKIETTNTEQAKTLEMKRLQELERQAAEERKRLENEMSKYDLLTSEVKKEEAHPIEMRKSLKEEFPPERNEGRPLPSGPETSTEGMTHPLQKNNPEMELQVGQLQASAVSGTPDVHILSFHASQPSVDEVEKVLKDVYKELAIQAKPKSPTDLQINIQEYILKYKPEYLVLVSEMEDIEDITGLEYQVQRYKEIVNKSCSVGKKIIFIVTKDKNYREGYLSSDTVHSIFTTLNQGRLSSEPPMVMSWNKTPWDIHKDKLTQLLTTAPQQYEAIKQHPTSGVPYTQPEHVPVKRRGFYRASISYGRVVQVLMSDPPDWEPDTRYLNDILINHRSEKKAIIEFWDEGDGRGLQCVVHPKEATLSKIAEGNASDKTHSILVYSYHVEEKTNDTVANFIHHLDVHAEVHKPCQPIDQASMMADIASVKPDYVMFSVDIDVLKDADEVLQKYGPQIKGIIEHVVGQGVIIMLLGDKYYKQGELLASREVTQRVRQLTQDIVDPDRLTVMSCVDRPYITHQEWMKKTLKSKRTKSYTPAPQQSAGQGATPVPSHPHYYKAVIKYGQIADVLEIIPPDWQPDKGIVGKKLMENRNKKHAYLEIFGNERGEISTIAVEKESKGLFYYWKKGLSWFSGDKPDSDDGHYA